MKIIIIIGARRPSRLCATGKRARVCVSARARERKAAAARSGRRSRGHTHISIRICTRAERERVGGGRAHAILFAITSPGPPRGYVFYPPSPGPDRPIAGRLPADCDRERVRT